jgi:hypothetical protein
MSKRPASVTAAWIIGVLGLVGVIIGVVVNFSKKDVTQPINVVTSGESSPGIAIGGEMKNSQIIVNPGPLPQEGLTKEVRTVVNQIIEAMDSVPSNKPKWASESSLISKLDEELVRNPYNVRALLVRGQKYYTDAISYGGQGMRQGMADFEKAASVDKTLADPHFGVGILLYDLGFFDIAQRGLYKIREKGGFRLNKKNHMLEMRSPRLEFFPDRRNRTIFQAALEEFETGQKLVQLHERSEEITIVFFEPQEIENRIRSIRQFLGHEPQMEQDDELVKTFTTALSKVNPATAFGGLFEFGKSSEK